ncbi:MAG TPA: NlpC/P60 family protein, partial [Gemmatimonadaceae bacterium]
MAPVAKLTAPGRGMVRAPLAPMYDRPNPASVQTSQRLAGFEVDLLKNEGDWFLARGTDAYEGWMHRAYLSPAPTAGARRSSQIIRVSLGCVTRSATGERRSLPLGARLGPDEIVRSGDVVEQPQLPVKFPRTALAITRSAKEFFEGAPYLWGGITPWGADCSGFVQSVFALHGVALPRNAAQ